MRWISKRNGAVVAAALFGVSLSAFAATTHATKLCHHGVHQVSVNKHASAQGAACRDPGVVSFAGGLVTVYPASGGTALPNVQTYSGSSCGVHHSTGHGHVGRVSYVHGASHYSGSAASCGDYLAAMGGESRWSEGHVIRVYVEPGKSTYRGLVANCFNQWCAASGGRIGWTMAQSASDADYTITWTTQQHELSSGTEAGLTTTDTDVDDATGREFIDHARTSVLTRYEGKHLSDSEVQKTILHEVGHGLGLEGHSPNSTDIMYYAVSPRQTNILSSRDKNTISRLYRE